MSIDLRIFKQQSDYNVATDKMTNTFTQVGETIHDINTIDLILDKKQWGLESEGGAIADVYGQDIIDILLADENKYTTNFIEEDEVYRVELSY